MSQTAAYEAVKTKIRAAEMLHHRQFSNEVKNTSAVILNNTMKVLNAVESFNGNTSMAAGGQMNPVGSYKNFIIKIASLSIPALDVFDWVAVEAMQTANTQILFTRYRRLSDKGTSKQGDILSEPFGVYYRETRDENGNVTGRENAIDPYYSGELVAEEVKITSENAGTAVALKWTPVREVVSAVRTESGGTTHVLTFKAAADGAPSGEEFTITETGLTLGTAVADGDKLTVTYKWDNKYLPANDLPTYGAKVEAIPLAAKPHKLRIVFDALDNLIYKNDYGIDISKELPKKAVEDFMFSIGTEVSNAIVANAPRSDLVHSFSLTAPNGWVAQHYASFGAVLVSAQAAITKVTNIYAGNRCFIGTHLLPVVRAVPGFKAADVEGKIGTQLVGSIGELKIYYKPDMDDRTFVVWAKGTGTEYCVGVLGIYLAMLPASIIPTQLLEFADGMNVQGFYSLYDYVHINPMLSVKGRVDN